MIFVSGVDGVVNDVVTCAGGAARLDELADEWEAVSKDEFRISHQDSFYWLFEFSREAGFAKSTKKRGAAQDESKEIRFLYKMAP